MKNILVPTDFSKVAQSALEVAVGIAKKAKAQITLLHVVEQPTSVSFNVTGEVDHDSSWEDKLFTLKLVQKAKSQLSQAMDDVTQSGVRVRQELRMGNPFHGIRTIITEHNVDLVVMGTEGHTRIEELIVGSNTEKVIRHSSCPVLSISRKPSIVDFKNIVYATSMLSGEADFYKVIQEIQNIFDATLHVVWINTPALFQPDTSIKNAMQEFIKKAKLKNYTLNIFNDYSVEEGIVHFAESTNADLIAMATHGRKGLAHILTRSIAESAASKAKRPVLTFVVKNNS
jgi:nucleotide-binding universal stress UspA family protein